MNEVSELYHLGPQQCGNQTAYGLPGDRYCTNYRAAGFEYCRGCCEEWTTNYPGSNVAWRAKPFVLLTHFATSGDIFVWPKIGVDTEAQHGHVFVFSHDSYWGKQMLLGPQSLREDWDGGTMCYWEDVVHVYEGPFKELGGLHGLSYSLDSLGEIAGVYGKPVPARS